MSARRREGFTLVEVAVAIAMLGLIAMLAVRLTAAATDAVGQLRQDRTIGTMEANGYRWLRLATGSAEIGDSLAPFRGSEDRFEFTTWLEQPGGWLERRPVVLGHSDSSLVVEVRGDRRVRLLTQVMSLRIDYLPSRGADTRWQYQWLSPRTAPVAVRLRISRQGGTTDTLLFAIGTRG